jgi:signal transduction histidine kinase
MSMRLRLILSFALVVALSIAGVVLIALSGTQREVRSFMSAGGMARLETIQENLEQYYKTQGTWEGAGTLLNVSHGMGQGQGGQGMLMNGLLVLADADGTRLATSSQQPVTGKLTEEELERSLALKSGLRTVGYLYFEGGMLFSSGDESYLVTRLANAALVAGLTAGTLALLLSLFLSYRLLRPVQELTRASHGMAQGDLSQRVRVEGDDEMAELARTFNYMAGSLQSAQASRRAMTADIAHELRTPLAVQRANLEALLDGVYPLNSENLAPVLEQNHLLTRLVDDLRTLALVDAGQLKLERVQSDLSLLAEHLVARFRAQAEKNGVRLSFSPPEAALPALQVDPQRIEQILSNLISNALRYTPAGGQIEVAISNQPGQVSLLIHDSGPGIPEDSLGMVFERFYRADKSRSRSEGGSGLGLAIARQLAEAHGGTLSAANHPQGGAVFTLTLPLQPGKPA